MQRRPLTTVSNSAFLDAAVEIGDQLAALAVTKGRRTSWKVINKATETPSYENNDLYAGCSGIGLFFLELYKHTRREPYLRLARRAIRTAAAREKAQPTASFISGRLGVAYALVRLYEVTGVQLYRARALALVTSCRHAHSKRQEYLGGNAGTVLSLLHIHAACQEPWLLEMANDYAEHMLQGIRPHTTGIYWDRTPFEVRPLCGFSHGAAGIGFVLLELGQYLRNPAFYRLAEQAFAYENAYFDAAHNNWPDFRINMWKPEYIADMEAAYSAGNLEAFYKVKYMSAWCHGAPGIGLSRIRAYQLTGDQAYLDDVNRSLLTTKNTLPYDMSLCHGLAGNLETFIESYLAFGRSRDWNYAQAFGKQLLKRWEETRSVLQKDKTAEQPDLGLFTGLAGSGYNLLRLHDPRLTPSILAPRLSTTLPGKLDAKLSALRITAADVQGLLAKADATDSNTIKQLKRQMIARWPSNGLLYIKYRVAQKSLPQLLQLTDDQLLGRALQLDIDCVTHMRSATEGIVLRYTLEGIEQKPLTPFCYTVLTAFRQPQQVRTVIDELNSRYHFAGPEQRQLLRAKTLEQIRQALRALILLETGVVQPIKRM